MITCEKNNKATWLAKNILGEEFLNLNPVIAGGAALFIYRTILYHNTDYKWNNLVKTISSKGISIPSSSIVASINMFPTICGSPVSDIDIWFLASNDIFNDENKNNFLVKNNYKETGSTRPNNLNIRSLSRFSNWCNTFAKSNGGKFPCPIQVMTSGAESVSAILKDFDFINCSVAWHNGILYYDSDLDDAFESFDLRLKDKNVYSDKNIIYRVFHANRSFKYSSRFNLDFDKELSAQILQTYIDSKDININAESLEPTIHLNPSYGGKNFSKNTVRSMVKDFYNNFSKFRKMKFFKDDWVMYVIHLCDEIPEIKDIVESIGANYKNINPPLDDKIRVAPRELWSGA